MQRQSHRHERVAGMLRRELSSIIHNEVQDPGIGSITVTDVEVTKDLSHAKVFVYSGNPEQSEMSLQALKRASGFLRHRLADEVKMRAIPQLNFRYDDTVHRSERIDQLLAGVRPTDVSRDEEE